MSDMKLRKVSVSEAAAGAWRVEIEIADSDDIATAQESVSAQVRIGPFQHPLLIDEVRLAALQRVREIVDPHIEALGESTRKARS